MAAASTTSSPTATARPRPRSVTVTIDCVNDDPTAGDDTASGTEDMDVQVTDAALLSNDSDPEGDPLEVTGVGNPTNGSVSLAAGVVTFIPDADVCGPASAGFDYTVEDGNGGSATGHVDIDLTCVNEAPVAGDDTISGDEDTDITVTSDELVSDDTDGDPEDVLTVTGVTPITGGTVSLLDGTITFTPDADQCGVGYGSFDYTVERRQRRQRHGHRHRRRELRQRRPGRDRRHRLGHRGHRRHRRPG